MARQCRSAWPISIKVAPASFAILMEISPVHAPSSAQWAFCAPSRIGEPLGIRSRTLASAVWGGSTKGWTPLGIPNASSSSTKLSASASVLFIFQLVPTHRGRLFDEIMAGSIGSQTPLVITE